jgi:hypothetical protein
LPSRFSEFDGAGHVVSEPVGAVDARDRLALPEIQDEPAAAEPFDARLRAGEAPAEAPDAREVECFSASEHEARHVFRLAVLVGVDLESARPGFVADVHLQAERCAFMAVEFSRQLAANGVGLYPNVIVTPEAASVVRARRWRPGPVPARRVTVIQAAGRARSNPVP